MIEALETEKWMDGWVGVLQCACEEYLLKRGEIA